MLSDQAQGLQPLGIEWATPPQGGEPLGLSVLLHPLYRTDAASTSIRAACRPWRAAFAASRGHAFEPAHGTQHLARPELDRAVETSAGEGHAVRRERHRTHGVEVPLQADALL